MIRKKMWRLKMLVPILLQQSCKIASLSLPHSLTTKLLTTEIQRNERVQSRRSLLGKLGTVAVITTPKPRKVNAAESESLMNRPDSILKYVYKIMRVQEATQQEMRLIKSGKFKDLQRANIKLAANMMLINYNLDDCVVQAARYAKNGKIIEATDIGRGAVEALNQINEYFDSSDRSLQVNTVSSEKQEFVVKALTATRSKLEQFLLYMPDDVVQQAAQVMDEENSLNSQEYTSYNDGSNGYLNPSPGR